MTNIQYYTKVGVYTDHKSFEKQRYGRNKETLVNHRYINTGEYRRKFDLITDNIKVNNLLYKIAKDILTHRSGSLLEDMYWIDMDEAKIVASQINSTKEKKIIYSKNIQKIIKNYKNIITIHSHPQSYPPSLNDFNSNFEHRYNLGIVCCHDGRIFMYSSNEFIPEDFYKIAIVKNLKKGYNEYKSQIYALNELQKNFAINFKEVLL